MMFSMVVYPRKYFLTLIKGAGWNNSNELELHLKKFADHTHYISSFSENVAVDTPVNNISGWNPAGKRYGYPVYELNAQFLDGKKIDLETIEKETITGCHQEVPFNFIERNNG